MYFLYDVVFDGLSSFIELIKLAAGEIEWERVKSTKGKVIREI